MVKYLTGKVYEIVVNRELTFAESKEFIIAKRKYGLYSAFSISHIKQSTREGHTHFGIMFKEKPRFKFCPKQLALKTYFATEAIPLTEIRLAEPLKNHCEGSKGPTGKLYTYYKYCTNKEVHPEEDLVLKYTYRLQVEKWQAAIDRELKKRESTPEKGVSYSKSKLTYEEQILISYMEDGKSLLDWHQEEDLPIKMRVFICKNKLKLQQMLSNYSSFESESRKKKYTLEDFDSELPQVQEIKNLNLKENKTIVIQGPSGVGKTQIAKALFKNPLLVRHMDKLKEFSHVRHDGIIFDDMAFSHIPREAAIHLVDLEEQADLNVKCSMVTIPEMTPRIICTNREIWDTEEQTSYDASTGDESISTVYKQKTSLFPEKLNSEDIAIQRRLKVIRCTDKLLYKK